MNSSNRTAPASTTITTTTGNNKFGHHYQKGCLPLKRPFLGKFYEGSCCLVYGVMWGPYKEGRFKTLCKHILWTVSTPPGITTPYTTPVYIMYMTKYVSDRYPLSYCYFLCLLCLIYVYSKCFYYSFRHFRSIITFILIKSLLLIKKLKVYKKYRE